MTKLIIRHGERVTEHAITEHALVVGRDPQCDLFFADKKLSRRHARFENSSGGIRLVDLGSRNGSWVNEQRIEDELLSPTDAIRLGALSISVEVEPEGRPDERLAATTRDDDQESTHFLPSEPSTDDSRTVVLSSGALPDAPSPDDIGTVMLASPESLEAEHETPAEPSEASPEDQDELASEVSSSDVSSEDTTLRKPPSADTAPHAAQTMMLEGESAPVATDTGTVIFRGKRADVDGQPWATVGAAELQPEDDAASSEVVAAGDESVWEHAPSARVTRVASFRFVVLVVAVAALAVAVLALPLLRTLGSALTAESALRGRALVELLAATNENALRDNRPDALSTARVASETGVVSAYIADPMGQILAPKGTPGEHSAGVFASVGADVRAQDIRAFRESEGNDGTVVYAVPVRAEGRRLGIAVLQFRVGAAVSAWTSVMLLLGSLLLLIGVGAAVIVARRWTLAPVQELCDDVEALRRGIVDNVAEERPYSDLASIARHFNEMAGRDRSEPVGDGSTTYKPNVDPTLVPDGQEPAEG